MRTANNFAQEIVRALLGDNQPPPIPVSEASVHRPNRGRIWIAVFTGPQGGQVWRSTGLADREQALLVARTWEAEARTLRARAGHANRTPVIRVRRSGQPLGDGPLSQREIGLLVGMSERAVRNVERRVIEKLRRDPVLREAWQEYLAGNLDEQHVILTRLEVEALLSLARTPEERSLVQKVLRLIQR